MLEYKEIKGMDKGQLTTRINQLRKQLFELKMQKAVSGLEKPHNKKILKKDIARLNTALSAK
jgi:large subunit ribosomal protein L29